MKRRKRKSIKKTTRSASANSKNQTLPKPKKLPQFNKTVLTPRTKIRAHWWMLLSYRRSLKSTNRDFVRTPSSQLHLMPRSSSRSDTLAMDEETTSLRKLNSCKGELSGQNLSSWTTLVPNNSSFALKCLWTRLITRKILVILATKMTSSNVEYVINWCSSKVRAISVDHPTRAKKKIRVVPLKTIRAILRMNRALTRHRISQLHS